MDVPPAAKAARPTVDLPPSDALSILANGPNDFKGRKLGMLLTDGSDATIFKALAHAIDAAGAVWEVVAPKIGGVTLDDGTKVAAKQKIDGGPSILFDAVAVLPGADGVKALTRDAASKDFVADAFGHCKFIGVGADAAPLFEATRIGEPDDGCLKLTSADDVARFVKAIGALRFWPREMAVDLDAASVK